MNYELQTMRLFSPLFPHIYRKDEWSDFENNLEDELKDSQSFSFGMTMGGMK